MKKDIAAIWDTAVEKVRQAHSDIKIEYKQSRHDPNAVTLYITNGRRTDTYEIEGIRESTLVEDLQARVSDYVRWFVWKHGSK